MATTVKSFSITRPFTLQELITPGIIIICLLGSYNTDAQANVKGVKVGVTQQEWGETDGKKVSLYTLTNTNGTEVRITNYGATITSWITKDKSGNRSNIVLG